MLSDQLTPVSSTENAIFGPTHLGWHKTSCEEGFIDEKMQMQSLLRMIRTGDVSLYGN